MVEALPPLQALRAFEAAARHLNFTRAGEELGMTQAAVSYQIRLLEERIGSPLFVRQPRQVLLSEVGERLAPGIIEAFALMRTSVAATRNQATATLTISTMQTFASHWLVRHIGSFQVSNPGIAVRFDVSNKLADFHSDGVDVGIRAGRGNWPGLVAHELLQVQFTPMLSPELAARVKQPSDLLDLKILDAQDAWWPQWFSRCGIDYAPAPDEPRLHLDSQAMVANLALAGQGVAILTPALFELELTSGQLVQPFDLVCKDDSTYWLVYPQSRRAAPHIRAFRDWILAEFAGSSGERTGPA